MHALVATLLLAAAAAPSEPALLLLPAIGRTDVVTVSGRVLKEAPSTSSSKLRRNVGRLATPNLEGASVDVLFEGRTVTTRSGHDGAFEATFFALPGRPFAPGPHELQVTIGTTSATTRVEVLDDKTPFLVVSDFDDTVAITNVRSKRGMVKAALLEDEETQPVVEGMAAFYRCLVTERPVTTGLAFVSGSPVQYGGRVERFLARHAFPFAALHLRNLGVDTLEGYKQPAIRRLLREVRLPIVLIGDSGEKDPEVFADIRREFPDRVLGAFIRDAGGDVREGRLAGSVLFRTPAEAAREAAARGFADRACVERWFPAIASPTDGKASSPAP